jgi:DNA polymerase-3 subunit delta
MKIENRDIQSFINAGLGKFRICLLYGPDEGKVREYSRALVAKLLGANPDPMNIVELTGAQLDDDPARLSDELCSVSLFGGERIVLLRALERGSASIIKEAVGNPAASTALIILGDDLAKDNGVRKWAESSPDVATVPCYMDEGAALDQIIRQSLQAAQVRTTPEVMQYLSNHLGNNRAITRSELDKIILYLGDDKELSLQLAMELVGENNERSMQDIAHAVAAGDLRTIPTLLRRLIAEGEAPVAIVRTVLRYFQKLQNMQAQIMSGKNEEEVIRASRTFFKFIPMLRRHLGRWSLAKLPTALERLHAGERELKGVTPLSPELITARLLMSVASSAGR